jgi:hypothetical protein
VHPPEARRGAPTPSATLVRMVQWTLKVPERPRARRVSRAAPPEARTTVIGASAPIERRWAIYAASQALGESVPWIQVTCTRATLRRAPRAPIGRRANLGNGSSARR